MRDRPKYVPWDQEEHLGPPPWEDGPELEAWEKAHNHDPRVKCIPEYGCIAVESERDWLEDEVERLRVLLRLMTDEKERLREGIRDIAETVDERDPRALLLAKDLRALLDNVTERE